MPGWSTILSAQERKDLIPYLKSLSRFFQGAAAPKVMDFTKEPKTTDERIANLRAEWKHADPTRKAAIEAEVASLTGQQSTETPTPADPEPTLDDPTADESWGAEK